MELQIPPSHIDDLIPPRRGLSTSQFGGLSTSQGGGMSTSSSNVYRSNIPPWPYFVKILEERGYHRAVEMIKNCLPDFLWPENYFK